MRGNENRIWLTLVKIQLVIELGSECEVVDGYPALLNQIFWQNNRATDHVFCDETVNNCFIVC